MKYPSTIQHSNDHALVFATEKNITIFVLLKVSTGMLAHTFAFHANTAATTTAYGSNQQALLR